MHAEWLACGRASAEGHLDLKTTSDPDLEGRERFPKIDSDQEVAAAATRVDHGNSPRWVAMSCRGLPVGKRHVEQLEREVFGIHEVGMGDPTVQVVGVLALKTDFDGLIGRVDDDLRGNGASGALTLDFLVA